MFWFFCWGRKLNDRWENMSFQRWGSLLFGFFSLASHTPPQQIPLLEVLGKGSLTLLQREGQQYPRSALFRRRKIKSVGNLDWACVNCGPTRTLILMDFWLCIQRFGGWALQWLEGNTLCSFLEGVCFDGSDDLLVSGHGEFGLCLPFKRNIQLGRWGWKQRCVGRLRRSGCYQECCRGWPWVESFSEPLSCKAIPGLPSPHSHLPVTKLEAIS